MFIPRPSAVRVKNKDTGEWQMTNPNDPLYSTASMIAEEFWDGEKWVPILEKYDVGRP